uniref:Kinesin family member 15 n=1 Tax=Amphilophus citrinellus TaxID=61819 RepID=A0A3Q0THE2_AMPCI
MNPSGKGSAIKTIIFRCSPKIGDSDSIKVFVRVRPLTRDTGLTTDGDQSLCLSVTSPNTIRLCHCHLCLMWKPTQFLIGLLSCSGQTGSGKTFTMLGPSELDNFTDNLRGVIPRSFEYLFFLINREVERICFSNEFGTCSPSPTLQQSPQSKSFLCKCSFIEIYNEQIYDLLDTASASLFLRENIKKGVFVEGVVEKFVSSAAEAYQVLSMGWRNRRVASTSMNRESSRSHAVFTMTLESKETINEVVNIRMSQLNLVDLAGSERQKDTHTEGSRLKEASSINRSLMCLGQVIMALVDVSNGKNRHICYRDSKLTFLLRDSLGGNAKTYIIANVHPGSKCFGETLSTLHFAQRAKLIKNKAVINEDTQGNVKQLQAEVKKLKEQLAQALASQGVDCGRDIAPGGPELHLDVSYKAKFMAAVRLWKKQDEEKKMLLKKVTQLEEAWAQKDKFIHSSRMIVRFREDHISRLEKKLKAGENLLSDKESQALIDQLKEEIKILKDQVEHHPKMTRYAAENYSLREENRQLRSLESVVKADEVVAQVAAEIEEAFQKAVESERLTESKIAVTSASVATDTSSAATIEKLNAKLLQKQTDLTAALQAFEEYKDVTKKQMAQLESEKRYLEKSNRHLENILEATNAYKKQEVSELNRIHVETLKILSTPTRAYNLRSRFVPLSSPEHLNGADDNEDSIWSEQPPSDMAEMALTEELRQVQEQGSRTQAQLNEEQLKNSKLLQEIAKLEEQVAVMTQESDRKDEQLSTERSNWNKDQLTLQETVNNLQQSLQSEQQAAEVLRSEIRDLRLVLQSSDKELISVKNELRDSQSEQQREMSQLSNSLISTQLQLDKVQLEWEQLLEQHRTLQDSFDQLQAEAKFEADQSRQQLRDRQQEIDELKAEITKLNDSLQTEQERTSTLISQLKENKESTSKELLETMEQNTQLKKQVSDLLTQNQQQVSPKNFVYVEVLQEEIVYATEEVERLTKVLDEQNSLLQASQEQTAKKEVIIQNLKQKVKNTAYTNVPPFLFFFQFVKTPRTPGSFNRDLTQVLESQERELENRRSSMMTMEILLAELNSERASKNEEIEWLKTQLTEKEMVRMEIQALLDKFYTKQNQMTQNGNNGEELNEAFKNSMLKELEDERAEKAQESMHAQSQTCIQELTTELRNRCLELRELNQREIDVLRKQNIKLSEENGKLVGHKNHKQRIEYLVKLKKDNTKLQEENEKLRTEITLMRDIGCPSLEINL